MGDQKKKEQAMLQRAAMKVIGSALKQQFEDQPELPDHIRRVLAQIDANRKRNKNE
jgi:hypothetical protein